MNQVEFTGLISTENRIGPTEAQVRAVKEARSSVPENII